jgi:hypothetical protein
MLGYCHHGSEYLQVSDPGIIETRSRIEELSPNLAACIALSAKGSRVALLIAAGVKQLWGVSWHFADCQAIVGPPMNSPSVWSSRLVALWYPGRSAVVQD